MNRKHGGLSPEDPPGSLDFSANINPLGPPSWLRTLISREIETLERYPEPDAAALRREAAAVYNLSPSQVIAGNGATELIYALCRAERSRTALIPSPCYDDYFDAALQAEMAMRELPLNPESGYRLDPVALGSSLEELGQPALVILGAPNNPTGLLPPREELIALMRSLPETLFCVDESFLDFCGDTYPSFVQSGLINCLVVTSLTKFYAVPGLRLGLILGSAEAVARVGDQLPSWSVNTLAQKVGRRALADREYAHESRRVCRELRERLERILSSRGELSLYPGEANFILSRAETVAQADELATGLAKAGIAVRRCGNFRNLDERFLRFAVRPQDELERLAEALGVPLPGSLGGSRHTQSASRGAVLMLQGTSSNAGKSLLTAALCRIARRRGLRTAPFKAQNMALNSSVTPAGGEIGRAQALQAAACGIDPDVRMNPVLLKPSSDTASQIVELGRPIGRYSAADYYQFKERLWSTVTESLDSLRDEYDLVIIEGAGSPGEVNLRRGDIVNMAVALYARAPVLLVGDIDRGGLFASFVGTLEVIAEEERSLIAGYLVNKFRGDPALLTEAYTFMKERTGKPVLGTIPYLRDHGLPEEDSVSFKESLRGAEGVAPDAAELTIAFIDLPHISNFTDLDPLRNIPGLNLVPILPESPAELLLEADACIIPGSKSVVADLADLEQSGIAGRLKQYGSAERGLILGICGGLQILGAFIDDPYGIESAETRRAALGMLPYTTTLAEKKATRLREAFFEEYPDQVQQGYEIHHGKSDWGDLPPLLRSVEGAGNAGGEVLGVASPSGAIWATYLHGILENPLFLNRFLNEAAERSGKPLPAAIPVYDLESRIDRFADLVEESLDIEKIFALLKG